MIRLSFSSSSLGCVGLFIAHYAGQQACHEKSKRALFNVRDTKSADRQDFIAYFNLKWGVSVGCLQSKADLGSATG
jgi:hypothetical protein